MCCYLGRRTFGSSDNDAVDNGDNAPKLDASAATVTSAESPQLCAERPRPVTRTAAEFRHSSSGLEPAAGFESCQTALAQLLSQPFFAAGSAPVSLRMTDKNAPAHIAKVTCRYQPVQLRTS